MCYHLWSPGCSRNCIATVRGVVSILVDQIAPQHGKGNSAQPCVHIQSSPEGHRETMKKECPRVYLNGLMCNCSVPVFHPGAHRCKLHVKGSPSWMRIDECPACATYCLELKPQCPPARNHAAAYPAVIRRTSKQVCQFVTIR